mmetsp:Transcript_5095/g.4230  ORF Transcript_5095/g.4230 Transcript_5095/m.4230 type:complete len:233 (+) Transcript_5095:210-908(+)
MHIFQYGNIVIPNRQCMSALYVVVVVEALMPDVMSERPDQQGDLVYRRTEDICTGHPQNSCHCGQDRVGMFKIVIGIVDVVIGHHREEETLHFRELDHILARQTLIKASPTVEKIERIPSELLLRQSQTIEIPRRELLQCLTADFLRVRELLGVHRAIAGEHIIYTANAIISAEPPPSNTARSQARPSGHFAGGIFHPFLHKTVDRIRLGLKLQGHSSHHHILQRRIREIMS